MAFFLPSPMFFGFIPIALWEKTYFFFFLPGFYFQETKVVIKGL